MIFILKVLHLIGFMLGAGAGIGSMVVARQLRRHGPSPALAGMRPVFGTLGLAGILLLWLSGMGLWLFRYDLVDLGPAYQLKLLVSAVLLAVILIVFAVQRRAAAAGTTPPAWVPRLAMSTSLLTLIALVLAALVFL